MTYTLNDPPEPNASHCAPDYHNAELAMDALRCRVKKLESVAADFLATYDEESSSIAAHEENADG